MKKKKRKLTPKFSDKKKKENTGPVKLITEALCIQLVSDKGAMIAMVSPVAIYKGKTRAETQKHIRMEATARLSTSFSVGKQHGKPRFVVGAQRSNLHALVSDLCRTTT